jgi:hypothetical protein
MHFPFKFPEYNIVLLPLRASACTSRRKFNIQPNPLCSPYLHIEQWFKGIYWPSNGTIIQQWNKTENTVRINLYPCTFRSWKIIIILTYLLMELSPSWGAGFPPRRPGAGFLRVLRFPLPIFFPPIAPQSPSPIIWEWYNRPEVAAVQGT